MIWIAVAGLVIAAWLSVRSCGWRRGPEAIAGGLVFGALPALHALAVYAIGGEGAVWWLLPLYGAAGWCGRTPLGVLNFLVLQWVGVRAAPSIDPATAARGPSSRWWSSNAPARPTPVQWHVLRWVWPLTGWWSPYRWIARRGAGRRERPPQEPR